LKKRAKPAFSKTYAAAAARRVMPSCNLLIATWYEILTGENGKPFVKGNPVFFSMSHSGDLVVMAVDIYPIGIDVELMKARNFAKLSSWFFGKNIPGCDGFYWHWTRFEAGLKLAGLTLFSKGAPVPEYLHSEAMGGYMLSVASNNGISLPLSVASV
jgi:hypothetical protein